MERKVGDIALNFKTTGVSSVVNDTSRAANVLDKLAASAKAGNTALDKLEAAQKQRKALPSDASPERKVALDRRIRDLRKAAETKRLALRQEVQKTIADQDALRKAAAEKLNADVATRLAAGEAADVVRKDHADKLKALDDEYKAVRRNALQVVVNARNERRDNANELNRAKALAHVRSVAHGVARSLVAMGRTGVHALGSVGHAAASVARKVGHVGAVALKTAVDVTVGNAWRGAVGVFHGVEHALAGIVHRLVDIAKKAALAAAAWYGFRTAADFKLVKESVAKAGDRADQVLDDANNMHMSGARDVYGRLREPGTDRSQAIVSAARGLGLDKAETMKVFSDFSDILNKAAASKEPGTNIYHTPEGQLLRDIGVQATDIFGQARKAEDVMRDTASALQRLPFATQQMVVDRLFAGNPQALTLLSAMMRSNGNLADFGEARAKRLGTFLDQGDLVQIKVFKRDVTDLKDSMEGVALSIARRVIPAIDDLARNATSFLVTYRTQIADVVATGFLRFVSNVEYVVAILEKETGFVERLELGVQGYLRKGHDYLYDAYQLYLRYIKPELPWVHAQVVRLSEAFVALGRDIGNAWKGNNGAVKAKWVIEAVFFARLAGKAFAWMAMAVNDAYRAITGKGAVNFPWMDAAVAKIKEIGRTALHMGKDLYLALTGQGDRISFDPLMAKIATLRDRLVAYVKESVREAMAVFKDGNVDGIVKTWAGRMAQHVMWLAQQLPAWWASIKAGFQDVTSWIVAAGATLAEVFAQLQVVLGGGENSRGASQRFPWLTDLVALFDHVVDSVTLLAGWIKTTYALLDNTFGMLTRIFGLNFGEALLFANFVKLTLEVTGLSKAIGFLWDAGRWLFAGEAASAIVKFGASIEAIPAKFLALTTAMGAAATAVRTFFTETMVAALASVAPFLPAIAAITAAIGSVVFAIKEAREAYAEWQSEHGGQEIALAATSSAIRTESDRWASHEGAQKYVTERSQPRDFQASDFTDQGVKDKTDGMAPMTLYIGDSQLNGYAARSDFDSLASATAGRTSPTPSWNR